MTLLDICIFSKSLLFVETKWNLLSISYLIKIPYFLDHPVHNYYKRFFILFCRTKIILDNGTEEIKRIKKTIIALHEFNLSVH